VVLQTEGYPVHKRAVELLIMRLTATPLPICGITLSFPLHKITIHTDIFYHIFSPPPQVPTLFNILTQAVISRYRSSHLQSFKKSLTRNCYKQNWSSTDSTCLTTQITARQQAVIYLFPFHSLPCTFQSLSLPNPLQCDLKNPEEHANWMLCRIRRSENR